MIRALLSIVGICVLSSFASAQNEDAVAKQKATAEEYLKAAGIQATFAETRHLIVYGAFSEAKVKNYAATMQDAFSSSARILKLKPDEKLWIGKLTVLLLPDDATARTLIQSIERKVIDRRDTTRVDVRGDWPKVIVPLEGSPKTSEAKLAGKAASLIGAAVLRGKLGGVPPPEWILNSFGRVAYIYADGPKSSRVSAHKQLAKGLLRKSRGAAFKWGTVEKSEGGEYQDLLATCLMEYMAFGPTADKFTNFVGAFRPSENGTIPSFTQALEVLQWPADGFDAAWQKWVATGR